jgi:hypothetical protein
MLGTVARPDAAARAEAWRRHGGPGGVTLLAPARWQVAFAPGEVSAREPGGHAAALVRQRTLPWQADLADWLWHQYPATEPGLHQVCMRRVEALPAPVACALFDYGGHVFHGRAGAVALLDGRTATVFVAAASRHRFAEALPVLVRILESRRPAAGGLSPAGRRAVLAHLLRLGLDLCDA